MKTVLIDTDILIDFFKKQEKAERLISKLTSEFDPVISILSISELCAGWNQKEASFFLPKLYRLVRVEPITLEIAEKAGLLRHEYKKKGRELGLADCLIAATALCSDAYLLTRNIKDYPFSDLEFYPRF